MGFLIVLAGVLAVALPVALLLHPEDGVTVPPPSTALRAELGAVLLRNEPPPRGDGQRAVLAEAADTLPVAPVGGANGGTWPFGPGVERGVGGLPCGLGAPRCSAPVSGVRAERGVGDAAGIRASQEGKMEKKHSPAFCRASPHLSPKIHTRPSATRSTWNRLKEGKRKEKTDERNLWPHRISGFTHSLSGLSAREKCGVAGCSVAS